MNRVSSAVAPPSKSTATKYSSNLALSWPASESPKSLDRCVPVHLRSHLITASRWISSPARLQPASSHDHGLQVHLQTHSITASKCISEFTWSPSPSASQTCSIKYIFKERRQLSGDTGITEVDRVMGSIYSADPGVDRHHLISISSYHMMKIDTPSFPTFGLSHSVRDFLDPRTCMDPHSQVVSYLLTLLLRSWSIM